MSNTAEALENTHAPADGVTATDALPENEEITVTVTVSEMEEEKKKKKPVKERKATTPREKKPKPPAHPPYFQMIKEAITALNEKGGSSPYAIAKFMEQNHKAVLPANFRKILGPQLKNSVAKGRLIKIKGSFKLSDVAKKTSAVAKTTKTRAARANAGDKSKEATKRRKPKSREVSKIDNPPPQALPTFPTRGRRSKRSGMGAKPKQLKSIKSPGAKKAKKPVTA